MIILPHNWEPRIDQMPLWAHMEAGGTKADVVAHRRWGKDDVALHYAATAAHKRIGTYWHMLPEAAQARKAIWDAINPRTGKRRIDEAFPKALRETTREQDMLIRFKCGSTWQVLGSDNYDSLVGSPPIGVVFSEWALARPDAYTYIRPILLENGGWAMFIWTPRGRNHATRAFESRQRDPATWFTVKIPATVTNVFTPEQLFKERQDLIDELGSEEEGEAKYAQEYLVDFDAAVPGSYFAMALKKLERDGGYHDTTIYDPKLPVDTAWDLGIDDYTTVWFFQRTFTSIRVIDYYETSGDGLDSIVERGIRPKAEARSYKFKMNYLPHDVMVRELGASGRSRRETLHGLGVRPIRVGVARNPEERINASRRMIPFCAFDMSNPAVRIGVEHLMQYRKNWNQTLGVYVGPKHDEHSHAADSFGEFAVNAALPVAKNDPKSPNPVGDRWFDHYKRGTESNWMTV